MIEVMRWEGIPLLRNFRVGSLADLSAAIAEVRFGCRDDELNRRKALLKSRPPSRSAPDSVFLSGHVSRMSR